jgi:hypothetical protein
LREREPDGENFEERKGERKRKREKRETVGKAGRI